MRVFAGFRCLALAAVSGLAGACALLGPLPSESSLDQRLSAFPTEDLPLEGRTVVHWDRHQIPFIEADHDGDAAFALGLAQAHLRLGQMEMFRRISQGRIAEMGGPFAAEIDHGLRILDFGKASAATEAILAPDTRLWLERFVAGVNHYQATVEKLPHEFSVLGFERQPWTVRDVLTFGRLAGTDVNWLVWFDLLRLRDREDWPRVWERLVANGSDSLPGFGADGERITLGGIVGGLSRSGSNALALAPERSASGGAILASDPHLGIFVPNIWLAAGVKSPSYHVVGLMIPGLPIFGIGRNPDIAWGGTNMRAASSDLFDVSGLDAARIAERTETVKVRWWFDREVTVRDTPFGPLLSDAPQLSGLSGGDFALRWTGHLPSDETTAFLRAARARDFEGFRKAFEGFAVPGQNMLYADRAGNIGQIMAVRLPRRDGRVPADVLSDPAEAGAAWDALDGVSELPRSYNPANGYLVSANNRPSTGGTRVGWFFSPDDRARRMAELLESREKHGLDDIEAIQRDVYQESSVALRDRLVFKLDELGLAGETSEKARAALAVLRAWDGHYRADSRGAVAYELFRDAFTSAFYRLTLGERDGAVFANVGRIQALLPDDIETASRDLVGQALATALDAMGERLDRFANWGDMHRLRLAHPLAFAPLIGNRFAFADHPIPGSNDTLLKTAHGRTSERHNTRFGANARFIADLSDPDATQVVLLGGQDGWFKSTTFLDQVPLWLAGDYVALPLSLDRVRRRAVTSMELRP